MKKLKCKILKGKRGEHKLVGEGERERGKRRESGKEGKGSEGDYTS